MSKHFCKCGHDQFTLEGRKVQGTWGKVHTDALVCVKCKESYLIEPCNTYGLSTKRPNP